jgi:hypothetical protein
LNQAHIPLFKLFNDRPSPVVLEYIAKLSPNDNAQVIIEIFKYFMHILQFHGSFFWEVIPIEFVFSFLNGDLPQVASLVVEFLQNGVRRFGGPDGLLRAALRNLLERFPKLRCDAQKKIAGFVVAAIRGEGGIPRFIEGEEVEVMLSELYPMVGNDTEMLLAELHKENPLGTRLLKLLRAHTDLNS